MNKKILILCIIIINLKSTCMEITPQNAPKAIGESIAKIQEVTKKYKALLQSEAAKKAALEKEIAQAKKLLADRERAISDAEKDAKKITDQLDALRKKGLGVILQQFKWRYDVMRELKYIEKWTTGPIDVYQEQKRKVIALRNRIKWTTGPIDVYQEQKRKVIALRNRINRQLQTTIKAQGEQSDDAKSIGKLIAAINLLLKNKFKVQ